MLTGMWLKTAIRCWKGESKWRKVFAAVVTMVCFIGILVIVHDYFYNGELYARGDLFAYCLAAFVLFIIHCFFTKTKHGIVGCITSLYVAFLIFGLSVTQGYASINKRRCLFKEHDDIVRILDIKDLPPCHFKDADVYSAGTEIQFDYDNPDSVKIAQFLEALQKEHPKQCTIDAVSHMQYSTILDDSLFVNIRFGDYDFVVSYGPCNENSKSMRKWVMDSLYYNISSCEMLSFEAGGYGREFCWEGLFKLERPMTETDISRLKSAVEGKKNREFSRVGDTCRVVYKARNGDNVRYHKTLQLEKDEKGSFSYAKVNFDDY